MEKKIFSSFKQKPVCWLRYVDGVFILWTYPLPDLQVFLHEVNNLSNSIKFTLKSEENESFHFLGYKCSQIDQIIWQFNTHPQSGQQFVNSLSIKYRSMHYVPILYEKLMQILQAYNIKLVALPPQYLIQILCNNIDKILNHQKAGIYEIPITLPNKRTLVYIGETKRKFSESLKENKRDISQSKLNTALARFCFANDGNRVVFDEARIIIPCKNPYRNKILESIRIIKLGQQIVQ